MPTFGTSSPSRSRFGSSCQTYAIGAFVSLISTPSVIAHHINPASTPSLCITTPAFTRLFHTREVLHHCLVHPNLNVLDTLEQDAQAYSDTHELLEPLVLMYNSLLETGDVFVAKGTNHAVGASGVLVL